MSKRNRRQRAQARAARSFDSSSVQKSDGVQMWHVGTDGRVRAIKMSGSSEYFNPATAGRADGLRATESDYAAAYAVVEWVYRCVEVVAVKVGQLLNEAKVHDRKSGDVLAEHPYYVGLERAFKWFRHDVYTEWVRARLIFGENYTEKVADASMLRQPFALRWLNPLAVEPMVVGGRITHFAYYGDDGRNVHLPPDAVTYDYTRNYFDDLRGLSPMRRALQAANLDVHYQKAHDSFFKNGAQPGLIISTKPGVDWQDADWDKFKTNIREKLTGADNAYRTLPVRAPVDITTLELPKPSDTTELSASQKERIAAVFGVPVGMVTFGDARYQLSPEQRKSFYEETVVPTAGQILKVVNADTLRFFDPRDAADLKLDLTSLAPILEDRKAQTEILNSRLSTGGITLNTYLEALGEKPLPNGDVFYVPSGITVTPLADIGKMPTAPTALQVQLGGAPYNPPAAAPLPANAVVRSKHASAEEELAAWHKVFAQSGKNKALRFVSYRLRDEHQIPLREAVTQGEPESVKAAFAQVRALISVKAIETTKDAFTSAFNNILEGARDEDYRRTQAQRQLYRAVQRFGTQAYLDGLSEGGVDVGEDELDREDQRSIARLLAEQGGYINDFMKRVYQDGISDALAEQKAEQWFARSIEPFHAAGLLAANENMLVEFAGEDGEESCAECQLLKGQRHRLGQFYERGLVPPFGHGLSCADGGHCLHKLVQVSGRPRGNWLGRGRAY